MRILVLAPQPFFQERGTPIAVKLLLERLAQRRGVSIDLLTYHEGSDLQIPGVTHHRISMPQWIGRIGPGVSLQKIVCDVAFSLRALRLVRQAKRQGHPFNLIHAVEESVFLASLIKSCFAVPYVYDMDSLLSEQLTQKWRVLEIIGPLLRAIERLAIRKSHAVVAVCDSLAKAAKQYGAQSVHLLPDVSLLRPLSGNQGSPALRTELKLAPDTPLVLYIGNLEPYQGIELLVRAYEHVVNHPLPAAHQSHLVIIGGVTQHIEYYQTLSSSLGLDKQVHFIGPRPVHALHELLVQATVLVSPRIQGNNTPMKLYSYLHSGVPIMATELPTHTQVLTPAVACLAPPQPEPFGRGLANLLVNQEQRSHIGRAARTLAEREYTLEAFSNRVNKIFDYLESQIAYSNDPSLEIA